ncbi:DNA gyrase inhibitor YacG [Sphingomonas sp.]|jgi:endogenous inhibitor of DNA gyrase (YacG/DUF329 family)|uniref:DNA gyrase inhibitor YacG n=1 Tax=Sphingomonas sp. TaxID=28214 RepID=UPI0035C85AA3
MKQQCPICGAPPLAAIAPFCSRGCKDRDLLRWLGEGYRLPGQAVDPEAIDHTQGLDSRTDTD